MGTLQEYFSWNPDEQLSIAHFFDPKTFLNSQERRFFAAFCALASNRFEGAKAENVDFSVYENMTRAAKIPDSLVFKGQARIRIACTIFFLLQHYLIDLPAPRFSTDDDMRAAFPFLGDQFDPFLLPFANWYAYSITRIRVVASKSCLITVCVRLSEGIYARSYISGGGKSEPTAHRWLVMEKLSGIKSKPRNRKKGSVSRMTPQEQKAYQERAKEREAFIERRNRRGRYVTGMPSIKPIVPMEEQCRTYPNGDKRKRCEFDFDREEREEERRGRRQASEDGAPPTKQQRRKPPSEPRYIPGRDLPDPVTYKTSRPKFKNAVSMSELCKQAEERMSQAKAGKHAPTQMPFHEEDGRAVEEVQLELMVGDAIGLGPGFYGQYSSSVDEMPAFMLEERPYQEAVRNLKLPATLAPGPMRAGHMERIEDVVRSFRGDALARATMNDVRDLLNRTPVREGEERTDVSKSFTQQRVLGWHWNSLSAMLGQGLRQSQKAEEAKQRTGRRERRLDGGSFWIPPMAPSSSS